MQEINIKKDIENLVVEITQIKPGIDYGLDLYSDVGVESINSLAILMGLEEKFEVQIEDTDFIQSRSINQISQLITKLIQ